MNPLRRLECRASLLALAIATAGASIHLAVEIATDAYASDERVVPVRCPGALEALERVRPSGAAADPSYLEAVERRCRADGAARCDVSNVVPHGRAIEAVRPLFGDEDVNHVFLRFSPAHHRIVWTVTAIEAGLIADVDAFEVDVIEFAAEGVTTN